MSEPIESNDVQQTVPAPVPLVALSGWLVPGAGYWLIGHRQRAMVIGVTIIVLFFAGVLIGGVRVVDPPDLSGSGSLVSRILDKPWFIGQVLIGPIGIVASWISQVAEASAKYGSIVSHARLAEIGTLYTAIAGMLNLLAIIDSSHRAAKVAE